MTLLFLAGIALCGLAGLVASVFALHRWPVLGMAGIIVSVVIQWELTYPPPIVTIQGVSIYFLDVFSVSALIVAVLRFDSYRKNTGWLAIPWLVVGGLAFIAAARGTLEFEATTALNEFRGFFLPFAIITWALSLPWNEKTVDLLIVRSSVVFGWALVLVGIYHAVRYGLGGANEFVDPETGIDQTLRPITSGQAMMLFLCSSIVFWRWTESRSKWMLGSLFFFFAMIVVAQQRTVWVVAVVAGVAVFVFAAKPTKKMLFAAAGFAFVGIAALAVVNGSLLQSLLKSASDSGTYDARVRSWIDLMKIAADKGLGTILFGSPYGTGWGRFEGPGRWVTFAPHNWYVEIYLRTGIVGLLLYAALVVWLIVLLVRPQPSIASVAIVVAVIVYGWSYSWLWFSAVFLGWAIASQTQQRASFARARVASQGAAPMARGELFESSPLL